MDQSNKKKKIMMMKKENTESWQMLRFPSFFFFIIISPRSIHIAIKKRTQCIFAKPKIQYMPIKDINNNLLVFSTVCEMSERGSKQKKWDVCTYRYDTCMDVYIYL